MQWDDTINPVSAGDCALLVDALAARLGPVPAWLAGKPTVFAACGANSIFRICCDVLSISSSSSSASSFSGDTDGGGGSRSAPPVDRFTYEEAVSALRLCTNQSDDELRRYVDFQYAEGPGVVVLKLALLVAVLRHTGVKEVRTVKVIGSCAGLLCDGRFWPEAQIEPGDREEACGVINKDCIVTTPSK